MRRAVGLVCVAAGVALAVPSAVPAQKRVGFEAPLGAEGIAEPVAPECSLSKRTLSCAVYGAEPPSGAQCDAGGAVTEVRLGAEGRAQRGFVCVDEGFHDWGVLSADQAWRRSGYDCAHRWSGTGLGRIGRLSCLSAGGYEFSVDGLGRINTPAGPQRGWLGLGDSYASGEGIPGTEPGKTAQGRDCRRATGNGTDAKAWSVGAYEKVRKRFGFGRIAFVACTGAITDEIESQLDEAAAGSGSGAWHMATLGIGGNNIRFSDVLLGCLDIPNHWDEFDLTPGCDADPARLRARVDMLTGKKTRKQGEYEGEVTLPHVLDQVAEIIDPGGDVVVSGYPQLVEEVSRWDRWRRTLIGNCEGILANDVGGLRGVTAYLNQQIAYAVHDADRRHKNKGVRFHFADIANDPYEYSSDPSARHSLCTRTPWLNGQTIGITSGDLRLDRSFHPMQVGHTNTARVVAGLMRDKVKSGDAADTPALTATPDEPDEALTIDGVGPIRLGMTLEEAEEAAGSTVRSGPFCVSLAENPEGYTLEVADGRVVAVVIDRGSDVATSNGVRVGDALDAAAATYRGQLRRLRGSEKSAQGPDAVLAPPGSKNAIVFWANPDGRINLMAVGRRSDVEQRVEFCA